MKFLFVATIIILLSLSAANADNKTITGFVFTKETGKALPGATIRVPGTNKGTYSSSRGFFRLNISENEKQIKVSSIGHKSKIINLKTANDTIFVYLHELPVNKQGVTVTGNIEADEIIRRAIARKFDNLKKLKTFKGRLYSKLLLEFDGTMFARSNGKNSMEIGNKSDDQENTDKYKLFLFETFSDVYRDYEKDIISTNIIQRRQTSNLADSLNLVALSKFFNLYDERFNFLNTAIVTPLSKDALSYYKFQIEEKQKYDDKYVYLIKVIPTTRLFPTFTGYIKIIEGDYNLVEADLSPSENTAIALVDSLSIKQKYRESVEGVWYPSFLELHGKINIEVIKSLFEIQADLSATSIYSNVQINIPLPDSIYAKSKKTQLSVAEDADSTKIDFWENNALREISNKELKIYNKIDSLVALDSTKKIENEKHIKWSIIPYIDFNRVSSVSLGITPGLKLYNFHLNGTAAYSFGTKSILWNAALSYKIDYDLFNSLEFGAGGFSKAGRISLDRSFIRFANTISAASYHFDYYDYMKSDGINIFAKIKTTILDLNTGIELSKQTSLPKTTNRSIFSNKYWRENPQITEGNYATVYLNGNIGNFSYILPSLKFENELQFSSVYGFERDNKQSFFSFFAKYKTGIPLFKTGYGPIKLYMSLEGGKTSDIVPMQYLNKMQSSLLFINKFGNFLTAPPAVYGGREYYAGNFALNLTDLWWRFLHLPVYQGRGLNLILAGAYSRFFAKGKSIYTDTGNYHYSEIGFGLTRIPTFISNIIYLSFDARWGIGPLASGRFGWAFSVSLPF